MCEPRAAFVTFRTCWTVTLGEAAASSVVVGGPC
jgi:hypothetical protein